MIGQGHGRFVVLPEPVGPGAERGRAVVREIGDRGGGVGDAEAEGPAPFVGDLPGEHGEALDLDRGVGLEPEEAPPAAELGRGDREVGRRHDPAEDLLGVALGRHVEVGPALGPVRGREEGEALGVVPVEMAEDDRARRRDGRRGARSPGGSRCRHRGRGWVGSPSWLRATHEVWPP